MDECKNYTVYLVVNKINGKVYVGKTSKSLEERWKEHWTSAFNIRLRKTNYFWRSLYRGGREVFDVCVIDSTKSLMESSGLEIKYIQEFKSHLNDKGYNTSLGGEGVHPNEATKRKISQSLKGRRWWKEKGVPHPRLGATLTEESRRKISEGKKGQKPSEHCLSVLRSMRGPLSPSFGLKRSAETIEKIRKVVRGRKHTEEAKRKIAEASSKRRHSEETKEKSRLCKLGPLNPMFGRTLISQKNSNPRYHHNLTYELIAPLLERGLSLNQISKEFKVTRKVIKLRIDQHYGQSRSIKNRPESSSNLQSVCKVEKVGESLSI